MRTIFLSKETIYEQNKKKEKLNIILSPEFYWVKIFNIPVPNTQSAILLLPNLFEEYFPTIGYSFYIIKLENNKYLSFAYDEKLIFEQLKKSKIPTKKIINIYFAQNEFDTYFKKKLFGFEDGEISKTNKPQGLKYKNEIFIYKENLFLKLPQNLADNFKDKNDLDEINISELELSLHSFNFDSYKKYMENRPLFIASGILFTLGCLLLLQGFILNSTSNSYPSKIEQIKEEYSLPQSLIETNALLDEYKNIEAKNQKSSEAIEFILALTVANNYTIDTLNIENGKFIVIFKKLNIDLVREKIVQKYKNSILKTDNENVIVEIKL